jgi:hypothetical protein
MVEVIYEIYPEPISDCIMYHYRLHETQSRMKIISDELLRSVCKKSLQKLSQGRGYEARYQEAMMNLLLPCISDEELYRKIALVQTHYDLLVDQEHPLG